MPLSLNNCLEQISQQRLQQLFGEDISKIIIKMLFWLQIGCHQSAIHRTTLYKQSKFTISYQMTGFTIWRGPIEWPSVFICVTKDMDTIAKCATHRRLYIVKMSRMPIAPY